ncbi:uncharacterized protein AMSG_07817 [Thecamonas trahens ATCC 50062]|uniref:Uncharacterized protein n=1 Tax=Thecamonas trahens ATCC 50062 TaxID=461836 RepID=A0A0L0DK59_THETB|nr:hypothetical protein AMSG_07817 [Thecamonas trahens ATCC 50062]KNC51748.1 hypothetical protein AMSG_07817 [Thecamonas trahens ATCC 50062]|eukprot:XP_013755876.1 hypothetical protein AMSG_07817 [Thecamonas trahens ATCC 50062]
MSDAELWRLVDSRAPLSALLRHPLFLTRVKSGSLLILALDGNSSSDSMAGLSDTTDSDDTTNAATDKTNTTDATDTTTDSVDMTDTTDTTTDTTDTTTESDDATDDGPIAADYTPIPDGEDHDGVGMALIQTAQGLRGPPVPKGQAEVGRLEQEQALLSQEAGEQYDAELAELAIEVFRSQARRVVTAMTLDHVRRVLERVATVAPGVSSTAAAWLLEPDTQLAHLATILEFLLTHSPQPVMSQLPLVPGVLDGILANIHRTGMFNLMHALVVHSEPDVLSWLFSAAVVEKLIARLSPDAASGRAPLGAAALLTAADDATATAAAAADLIIAILEWYPRAVLKQATTPLFPLVLPLFIEQNLVAIVTTLAALASPPTQHASFDILPTVRVVRAILYFVHSPQWLPSPGTLQRPATKAHELPDPLPLMATICLDTLPIAIPPLVALLDVAPPAWPLPHSRQRLGSLRMAVAETLTLFTTFSGDVPDILTTLVRENALRRMTDLFFAFPSANTYSSVYTTLVSTLLVAAYVHPELVVELADSVALPVRLAEHTLMTLQAPGPRPSNMGHIIALGNAIKDNALLAPLLADSPPWLAFYNVFLVRANRRADGRLCETPLLAVSPASRKARKQEAKDMRRAMRESLELAQQRSLDQSSPSSSNDAVAEQPPRLPSSRPVHLPRLALVPDDAAREAQAIVDEAGPRLRGPSLLRGVSDAHSSNGPGTPRPTDSSQLLSFAEMLSALETPASASASAADAAADSKDGNDGAVCEPAGRLSSAHEPTPAPDSSTGLDSVLGMMTVATVLLAGVATAVWWARASRPFIN